MSQLADVAHALVAPGKGILAADESTATIQRRFDAIGVENTEPNRRAYRELLFRTSGVSEYISGVILYDETIRQTAADETPLVRLLEGQGILPGIKVDLGAKPLPFARREQVTEGLDGLRERLAAYRDLGATFTKWRAVLTIGQDIPSWYCIDANAQALARYAALSQEAGLVPMVEPEVLMEGDHPIERCAEVTARTLREVFRQLAVHRVAYDGLLLKVNMVLSGASAETRASPRDIAHATVACLRESVPAAVPGILFLSGGQSDEDATVNLDAISRYASEIGVPWQLSFSYGRGLQAAPQRAWSGNPEHVAVAQQAYRDRARLTAAARSGKYAPDLSRFMNSRPQP